MSASSKKKLRNELNAAKMTERQLQEQKEAKKLKLLTVSFTAILALILVVAISFAAFQFFKTSGIREKNTVAVAIGDTELTNAQLNYYYVDAAFNYANTYGMYASMFGLDLYSPLNAQVRDEETGSTWADYFTESAINNAKATYALCAEAEANGFTLSEEEQAAINENMDEITTAAHENKYPNVDKFIQAYYGAGASLETYREYTEMNALAQAYYAYYAENLTYDDAALRAGEEGKEAEFNSYSYNTYFLNSSSFLEGGTTDEEGNTTYTDEERAAALAKAEEAAQALTSEEITSVEALDAAIAALPVNAEAETAPASTAHVKTSYSALSTVAKEWLSDPARVNGDVTYLENFSTSTAEDGTETKTVNGYYVVYFLECSDNNYPLADVRHVLIQPEGGTYDSYTGTTTYSEEELAAAKAEAEALLAQWLEGGDLSEESFAALSKEHNDDPGSKENGGLYEGVYPGQMVANFNDWCFDEARQPGDTGIVESNYGCHIMFYVGDNDKLYRDMLIENTLLSTDLDAWYNALVDACNAEAVNTEFLSRNLILAGN